MSWLSKGWDKAKEPLNQVFGPKSWVTGAKIGMGALGFKALGGSIPGLSGLAGGAGGGLGGTGGSGSGFSLSGMLPSLLSAGGSIYSANMMAKGQQQANEGNIASAREQMAFQADMSNTSHQREVADLRAAGLNPVLSANSGASTPVGSSANISNAAPNYSGVASAAIEARRLQQEIAESNSRIGKNDADADLSRAHKPVVDYDAEIARTKSSVFKSIIDAWNKNSAAPVKKRGLDYNLDNLRERSNQRELERDKKRGRFRK